MLGLSAIFLALAMVNSEASDPKVQEIRAPEYPEAAVKAQMAGTVRLSLSVAGDGSVRSAEVEKSLNPLLDATALRAAREWRYEPTNDSQVRKAVAIFEFSLVVSAPSDGTCVVGPSQVTVRLPNLVKIQGWSQPPMPRVLH